MKSGKVELNKSKVNKKEEIRAEINEFKTGKQQTKANKTKSQFFEKANKVNKSPAKLIKKKKK